MNRLIIAKIGGGVIDDPNRLDSFLERFAASPRPKILVHGGGREASAMAARLGLKTVMIGGRRVTDPETLKIAVMVYAGLINKNIVAGLQKYGCNALGLSGADGNMIPAVRRPPHPADFGYVGDVNPADINTGMIDRLLSEGVVPVFCAITHDGRGILLNTNADTIAASLAAAMSAKYEAGITFCFEKHGVLNDPSDERSVIPRIDRAGYEALRAAGTVEGGMVAKLDNAFAALEQGVSEVRIQHDSEYGTESGTILRDTRLI